MKTVILYSNSITRFVASSYKRAFDHFRQLNEYERFLECLMEEVLGYEDKVSDKPLVMEIQSQIKDLIKEYEFYAEREDDENITKVWNKMFDAIDLIVLNSPHSIKYFEEWCDDRILEEVYLYD